MENANAADNSLEFYCDEEEFEIESCPLDFSEWTILDDNFENNSDLDDISSISDSYQGSKEDMCSVNATNVLNNISVMDHENSSQRNHKNNQLNPKKESLLLEDLQKPLPGNKSKAMKSAVVTSPYGSQQSSLLKSPATSSASCTPLSVPVNSKENTFAMNTPESVKHPQTQASSLKRKQNSIESFESRQKPKCQSVACRHVKNCVKNVNGKDQYLAASVNSKLSFERMKAKTVKAKKFISLSSNGSLHSSTVEIMHGAKSARAKKKEKKRRKARLKKKKAAKKNQLSNSNKCNNIKRTIDEKLPQNIKMTIQQFEPACADTKLERKVIRVQDCNSKLSEHSEKVTTTECSDMDKTVQKRKRSNVMSKCVVNRFHQASQTDTKKFVNKLTQYKACFPPQNIPPKQCISVGTQYEDKVDNSMVDSVKLNVIPSPKSVSEEIFRLAVDFNVLDATQRVSATGDHKYGMRIGYLLPKDVEKSFLWNVIIKKADSYNLSFASHEAGVLDLYFSEEEKLANAFIEISKARLGLQYLCLSISKISEEKDDSGKIPLKCLKATIVIDSFAFAAFHLQHKASLQNTSKVDAFLTIHNVPEGIPISFLKFLFHDAITVGMDTPSLKFTQKDCCVKLGMSNKDSCHHFKDLFLQVVINDVPVFMTSGLKEQKKEMVSLLKKEEEPEEKRKLTLKEKQLSSIVAVHVRDTDANGKKYGASEVKNHAEVTPTPKFPADTKPPNIPADSKMPKEHADSKSPKPLINCKTPHTPADSKTPHTPADSKTPQIPAGFKTSKTPADSKTPQIPAGFKTSKTPADSKTPQIPAGFKTSKTPADSETPQIPAGSKTSKAAAASKILKSPAELKTPKTPADPKTSKVSVDSETPKARTDSKSKILKAPANSKTLETPTDSKMPKAAANSKTPKTADQTINTPLSRITSSKSLSENSIDVIDLTDDGNDHLYDLNEMLSDISDSSFDSDELQDDADSLTSDNEKSQKLHRKTNSSILFHRLYEKSVYKRRREEISKTDISFRQGVEKSKAPLRGVTKDMLSSLRSKLKSQKHDASSMLLLREKPPHVRGGSKGKSSLDEPHWDLLERHHEIANHDRGSQKFSSREKRELRRRKGSNSPPRKLERILNLDLRKSSYSTPQEREIRKSSQEKRGFEDSAPLSRHCDIEVRQRSRNTGRSDEGDLRLTLDNLRSMHQRSAHRQGQKETSPVIRSLLDECLSKANRKRPMSRSPSPTQRKVLLVKKFLQPDTPQLDKKERVNHSSLTEKDIPMVSAFDRVTDSHKVTLSEEKKTFNQIRTTKPEKSMPSDQHVSPQSFLVQLMKQYMNKGKHSYCDNNLQFPGTNEKEDSNTPGQERSIRLSTEPVEHVDICRREEPLNENHRESVQSSLKPEKNNGLSQDRIAKILARLKETGIVRILDEKGLRSMVSHISSQTQTLLQERSSSDNIEKKPPTPDYSLEQEIKSKNDPIGGKEKFSQLLDQKGSKIFKKSDANVSNSNHSAKPPTMPCLPPPILPPVTPSSLTSSVSTTMGISSSSSLSHTSTITTDKPFVHSQTLTSVTASDNASCHSQFLTSSVTSSEVAAFHSQSLTSSDTVTVSDSTSFHSQIHTSPESVTTSEVTLVSSQPEASAYSLACDSDLPALSPSDGVWIAPPSLPAYNQTSVNMMPLSSPSMPTSTLPVPSMIPPSYYPTPVIPPPPLLHPVAFIPPFIPHTPISVPPPQLQVPPPPLPSLSNSHMMPISGVWQAPPQGPL